MIRHGFLMRLWVAGLLLPLVSGCGGGMGGLTPAGKDRQRHEAAAERIEGLGGRVVLGDPGTSVTFFQVDPEAIAEALPRIKHLMRPDSVTIVPATGSDRAGREIELSALGELPNLRHVLVRGMDLSRDDLQYLTGLPRLRELHLIDTDLTDHQLATMATEMNLEDLTLVDQPITDQGLVNLKRMQSLRRLRLVGTQATESAASELTEALPRLLVELDGQTLRGQYAPQ